MKVEGGKLSPKILMVESHKRLSWQYHRRRSEIWKLAAGTAGVVRSKTNQEGPLKQLQPGEVIRLDKGLRHRLVGLAHEVIEADKKVDALHREIEESAILVIARRQPMAQDLRETIAAGHGEEYWPTILHAIDR